MASAGGQKHSSGHRNIFPGARDIANIAKPHGISVGIYERDLSIYNLREETEEEKLFEVNESVRTLLENLETRDKKNLENIKDEDKA